jgi:hypothetical protein
LLHSVSLLLYVEQRFSFGGGGSVVFCAVAAVAAGVCFGAGGVAGAGAGVCFGAGAGVCFGAGVGAAGAGADIVFDSESVSGVDESISTCVFDDSVLSFSLSSLSTPSLKFSMEVGMNKHIITMANANTITITMTYFNKLIKDLRDNFILSYVLYLIDRYRYHWIGLVSKRV